MDTNQQLLQNIVEFISQTVSLNRRLDKKKVDNTTAKLAFSQLDKKRKGYLDLADVYSLCGESTEDDLFVVFKWLDASKTGDVTYEDFQQVMTTQSHSQKKQQSSPVDSIKTLVTTFLQNWDYSKGSKAKLGINKNSLSNLFRWICQCQRKNSLTVEDLYSTLSNSKGFDSLCKDHLKNMFWSVQCVTERTFVEAFTTAGECETEVQQFSTVPQGRPHNQTYECNQEQLLDEFNNEYLAKRTAPKFSGQNTEDVNKFISQKYPRNLLERENRHAPSFTREQAKTLQKQVKVPQRKDTDFKNGDIESLLSNIEKRREQLKKGSLERKKLIEDALSRKKSTAIPNLNTTEQFEPKKYSRPVSTPKTNSYSQVCINNFIDSSKNDFSKIFNRYRDERENVANVETQLNQRKFDFQNKEPERIQVRGSKFMDKAYSSPQDPCADLMKMFSPQSDLRKDFFRSNQTFFVETPKFSQTAQENFFERPSSAQKIDRFEQIRQKINHLPERNPPSMQREVSQIDRIIEKYKNIKNQPIQKPSVSPQMFEFNQQPQRYESQRYEEPQRYEQVQRDSFSAFLMNQSPSNLRGIENFSNYQTQQKATPESYIQDQKGRLNGSIYQYRSQTGSVQKENLMKRAEEQAARKIHEIERKAKLKVLERKSAVGLKWVK